eukprot:gene10475-21850_t
MFRTYSLFIILSSAVQAFKPSCRPNLAIRKLNQLQLSPSEFVDSSSLLLNVLMKVPANQARAEFYFFFFAGSGALGIGAAQIPKVLAEFKSLELLKGGKTEGGPDLQCGPIATLGFPEPLKEKDILKIIDKFPSVEEISKKGPKASFLAQQGYLERQGFEACLKDCNPLALFAAFSCFTGGSDLAAPGEAQDAAMRWKSGGIEAFKADLFKGSLRRVAAYGFFAFLIALVLDLIIESANMAFFQ